MFIDEWGFFLSKMATCKRCGIEKLSNEYPPVAVSDECDHPPLECLRVCKTHYLVLIKRLPGIIFFKAWCFANNFI